MVPTLPDLLGAPTLRPRCGRCKRPVEQCNQLAVLDPDALTFLLRCHGATRRVRISIAEMLRTGEPGAATMRRLDEVFTEQPRFRIRATPGRGQAAQARAAR